MSSPALIWFRQDFRLDDNPALYHALTWSRPIIPVYIDAPEEEGEWPPGGASRWWLHHALIDLDASLRARGSRLVIRRGPTLANLLQLAQETGASHVSWNRRYEPASRARDEAVKAALRKSGIVAESFCGSVLFEPHTVSSREGRPFQVFSPFWRHVSQLGVDKPIPEPRDLPSPPSWPGSLDPADLGLLPKVPWDSGLRAAWTPGERGAQVALQCFVSRAARYAEERDRPDLAGTSRLSPYLHWGHVSPRRVWHTVLEGAPPGRGREHFLREVGWREFAYHLLYHFPDTPRAPLRAQYTAFPFEPDPVVFAAWRRGRTGYPIVDAGMRELWATGWMHNRVRMIVASFLVKHLLQPWQDGAAWFWDTLVDADLASNTLGWQWTAGCGADAAPYFRIFNPILQGVKFDPDGAYVRRWVPELAALPNEFIHKPWDAGELNLRAAGVVLGVTYPRPIIDHTEGRDRALAALARLPKTSPVP